jgi:hypothetical protein
MNTKKSKLVVNTRIMLSNQQRQRKKWRNILTSQYENNVTASIAMNAHGTGIDELCQSTRYSPFVRMSRHGDCDDNNNTVGDSAGQPAFQQLIETNALCHARSPPLPLAETPLQAMLFEIVAKPRSYN